MTADEQLLELQRFAELGRLSAYLLHEISNPLTAALLHLELSQQRSRSVRQARRSIKLLNRYVESARQQVRHQSSQQHFSVQAQVDQLTAVIAPLAQRAGVELCLETLPNCRMYGDPVKFQQIISNLLTNAIDAAPGRVQLTGSLQTNQLVLQVRDWGEGISPALLAHVFDNFVSTKAGSGLGLGLAIVKHYVTVEFGGSIYAHNLIEGGSCFTLKLPLSEI